MWSPTTNVHQFVSHPHSGERRFSTDSSLGNLDEIRKRGKRRQKSSQPIPSLSAARSRTEIVQNKITRCLRKHVRARIRHNPGAGIFLANKNLISELSFFIDKFQKGPILLGETRCE